MGGNRIQLLGRHSRRYLHAVVNHRRDDRRTHGFFRATGRRVQCRGFALHGRIPCRRDPIAVDRCCGGNGNDGRTEFTVLDAADLHLRFASLAPILAASVLPCRRFALQTAYRSRKRICSAREKRIGRYIKGRLKTKFQTAFVMSFKAVLRFI